MSKRDGLFIVIEGTDGSGKGTQFRLLCDKLTDLGYDVAEFDFPQYENASSYFVRQYLNGRYGSADEVGPYTGSLFYALDRYEVAPQIRDALAEGKVVIANRFTGSSMAHQATKLNHAEERRGFFIWLDNLEFQMLGIPRPDRSFVLRVPADIAQTLIDQKPSRSYTNKKRDLHESDLEHMKRSVEVYDDLCQLFPKDFNRIDCVRGGKLMGIDTIHEQLYKTITPLLPKKRSSKPNNKTAAKTKPENPYVKKTQDGYEITADGEEFLRSAVTNVNDNVYGFTDRLSTVTIAAAMARLSRRGDDMRITLLDEFATTTGKDEKLLQRVITAYGDDSVQQLVGLHIVVEEASNLLTKKLEWGRLAAYLEQSTRYIYFDQKDSNGNYKYFTPDNFDDQTKRLYRKSIDTIFKQYANIVHELASYIESTSKTPSDERDGAWRSAVRAQACDAARPLLPVATKATVGIFASGQALEGLIMRLMADEMHESKDTGQKILNEARKIMPTFLERADKPERGGATIAYTANTRNKVRKTALKFLPDNHSSISDDVELVSYWPKNELDLLSDMLYEHSNLPLKDIQKAISKWPIERKHQTFNTYMGERLNRRHKPGRAIEKAHYSWDLVCDYGIFRDLQRHRMVDDMAWQQLTPRYGYEVPKLVDEAGLTEQFEQCFEISLKLHSSLQAAGYEYESQYATLLGHKMRWKVTYNAREAFHLHELRTSPQGHPGYRKLVKQMHDKLCEVHPMLGEAMKFVNQGEDPELARLAAERYTQFKLKNLKS